VKKMSFRQAGKRPDGRCDMWPFRITDYRLSQKGSFSADEMYLTIYAEWAIDQSGLDLM